MDMAKKKKRKTMGTTMMVTMEDKMKPMTVPRPSRQETIHDSAASTPEAVATSLMLAVMLVRPGSGVASKASQVLVLVH